MDDPLLILLLLLFTSNQSTRWSLLDTFIRSTKAQLITTSQGAQFRHTVHCNIVCQLTHRWGMKRTTLVPAVAVALLGSSFSTEKAFQTAFSYFGRISQRNPNDKVLTFSHCAYLLSIYYSISFVCVYSGWGGELGGGKGESWKLYKDGHFVTIQWMWLFSSRFQSTTRHTS